MSAPELTLQQLQAIESEARTCDSKASAAKRLEECLARIRTSEQPLMVRYKGLGHYQDEIRSAIEGIINEHGADLLRIVEMRNAAFARDCRVRATQLRAQLATVVAPEPEATGSRS